MLRQVITCDHCGAVVPNEHMAMALPYDMRRPDAQFASDYVHGCSKEHLGLALAKAFELPVNVNVAHLQSEANAKSARIIELETAWDMLKKSLDESDLQRRELLARIAALEASLAPVTADGKTPGQVFAQISSQTPLSLPLETAREIIASGLLRAFGNAPPSTDTEHGLGVVRAPFAGNDHPHEVGSCSHCDTPTPKADAIKLAREVRDAAQSAYAAAGITVPTKPTKPVSQ